MSQGSTMTLAQLAAILTEARLKVGNGRFTMSVGDGSDRDDFYLFHRFYPTPHAFEDVKQVGGGSVDACIAGLGDYIRQFQEKNSREPLTTHVPDPTA